MLILLALGCTPPAADCGADELDDEGVCVPARCGRGPWGLRDHDEATILVDPAGEGTLSTIQEAVDLAAHQGGGDILVAAGIYPERVHITASVTTTLRGRCPALVEIGAPFTLEELEALDNPRDPWSLSAIWLDAEEGRLELESLSLVDAVNGLTVSDGIAALDEVVVDGVDARGLYATATVGEDVALFVEDSLVRHTQGALWDPSKSYGVIATYGAYLEMSRVTLEDNAQGIMAYEALVDLSDVSVLRSAPQGDPSSKGRGLVLGESHGELDGILLECNTLGGLSVYSQEIVQASDLSLRDVEIRDTLAHDILGAGYGAYFQGGLTHRKVEDLRILGSAATSLSVSESSQTDFDGVSVIGGELGVYIYRDSSVSIRDLWIEGSNQGGIVASGLGLIVQGTSVAEVEGAQIVDVDGTGIVVIDGTLVCTDCAVRGASFAGAADLGGHLSLVDSEISEVALDATLGGGFGVYAKGLNSIPVSLELTRTEIAPQALAGVYVDGYGLYNLVDNTIHGGDGLAREDVWPRGTAVFATGGVSPYTGFKGLRLVGNLLTGAEGGGLFLDGSAATLGGNSWSDNAVDLVQQRCGETVPLVGLEDEPLSTTELCPEFDYLTQAIDLRLLVEDVEVEIDF